MKRRDILRSVPSAAIAAGVMSSVASADEQPQNEIPHVSVRTQYDTPATVKSSFEAQTEDLLETLDEQGLIDTTDISSLDAFAGLEGDDGSSLKSIVDPDSDQPEDLVVMSTFDERTETPTSVIRVTEEIDGRTTKMFALPEAGRSYAIVERDSGEDRLVYPTAASTNCRLSHYEYDCTSELCRERTDRCQIFGYWLDCVKEWTVTEKYAVYCCPSGYCYRELDYRYCSHPKCCTEVGGTGCSDDCAGC